MSTVPKARRPSDEKRFGRPADGADADGPRTIAVIDVGTSSIRMAVAETASGGGRPRVLEQLSQAVALGRDTFTTGVIGVDATEQCVRVLRDYLDVLEEYGVTDRRRVRVVATTAVREAGNRLTFIDRVFGATGLDIEAIEQAEVNRLTYLSVLPVIGDEPSLAGKLCCVVEVGGGSTEILLVRDGDIVTTATARLGTLRLRETLEQFHASEPTARTVMSRQIDRVARQLVARIDPDGQYGPIEAVVALGADVRFAARQLSGGPEPVGLAPLVLDDLASLAGDMLEQSENDLIRRLGLSVPSAETLRPALLAYVSLARSCGVDEVLVCGATLRDGLLLDLAAADVWTDRATRQIVHSALELARKYDADVPHATHVASLAGRLFEELAPEHRLRTAYNLPLRLAGLLHEIGLYIGQSSHHKHAMYLILNSELFGLGRRERLLVALVARYHRRASPKPSHAYVDSLDRDDRVAIAKLAAILRVAIALDESRSQRVGDFTVARDGRRIVLTIPGVDDVSLERLALNQSGPLFEEVFGRELLLRTDRVNVDVATPD